MSVSNPTTANPASSARLQEDKYNDDLLLHAEYRAKVQQRYPNVFFSLDFEELREKFQAYDATANQSREELFRSGALFVLGAFLLLSASAVVPPLKSVFAERAVTILKFVVELGSIIITALGAVKVFVSTLPHFWLVHRLMTERIRQWHFQYILGHAVPLLSNGPPNQQQQQAYRDERKQRFDFFIKGLEHGANSQLAQMSDAATTDAFWLVTRPQTHTTLGNKSTSLKELADALLVMRADYQLRYCNLKLATSHRKAIKDFLKWPSRSQQELLTNMTQYLLGGVLFATLVGMIAHLLSFFGDSHADVWAEFAAGIAAICGFASLAVAGMREGMGVDSEIARYRDYRFKLERAIQKLQDTAATDEDILRAFWDVEDASMGELMGFLQDHHEKKWSIG